MTVGKTVSLPVRNAPADDPRRIRRSKSTPRRFAVLGIIQILLVAHVVQWAITGRSVSPLEPSESMELVKHGVINAGAILFGVALLSTLVLGRWFCGWGCHLVLLQDACASVMKKIGVRPRLFRSRLLLAVPFILAMYMFVWPLVYRFGWVPLSASLHQRVEAIPVAPPLGGWPGFSSELVVTDFWATFPPWYVAVPLLFACGFGCVYFLGAKGFCTYGCPYGGFFAPLDQYAPARIRVTDDCEQCGHCTAACTSNVRVHDEVREYGMVVDPGCMKCLDCVSVCPNDALYFGWGKPASAKGAPRNREPARHYDLTWPEEIAAALVFLLVFLAVRGVYGLVPMLGAVGVAAIVTFTTWKLWRMTRDASVSLHRFRLRFKGAVTPAGWTFATLATLTLVLVAHCGAVRAALAVASRADDKVTISSAAIFATAPMEMPEPMAAHAARAIRWYGRAQPLGAGGIGLLASPGVARRLAWLHACRHDFAAAERVLREQIDRSGVTDVLAQDVVLMIHQQERPDDAEAFARATVHEHPEFVRTYDALVQWLAFDGRPAEAIAICTAGVEQNEGRRDAHLLLLRRLSLLHLEYGNLREGIRLIEQTIDIDDTSPDAFAMLARAYRDVGEPGKAVAAMRRAVEIAPDNQDLRDELRRLEADG